MDTSTAFGGLFGSLMRDYPLTRLLRFILFRTRINEKMIILLSSLISLIITQLLLVTFNSFTPASLVFNVISIGFLSIIDVNRTSHDKKIIKTLHHPITRWVIGILSLPVFFIVFHFLMISAGILDEYYLFGLILSLIYCYFIVRKRKTKISGHEID